MGLFRKGGKWDVRFTMDHDKDGVGTVVATYRLGDSSPLTIQRRIDAHSDSDLIEFTSEALSKIDRSERSKKEKDIAARIRELLSNG